jgi:hypothetical protein
MKLEEGMSSGNGCYYSVSCLLSKTLKYLKIKVYKTISLPVVL